jgi:hypothetical protein
MNFGVNSMGQAIGGRVIFPGGAVITGHPFGSGKPHSSFDILGDIIDGGTGQAIIYCIGPFKIFLGIKAIMNP